MKHCNIPDVTQLAKQSDPMQTYLFGESKASELNFVGDLAEKISKSASPKRTRTPTKPSLHTNRPERIHWNRRLALPSPGTFLPMSTSLFGRLPSGENGDRQGIIQNNPVTRISGRKLQRKRPPTNQFRFRGKRCRYDFPFSCPSKGTSPSKGGREVAVFRPELVDNYTTTLGSTDHTWLENRTVKPSLANQPPFLPLYCLHHRLP